MIKLFAKLAQPRPRHPETRPVRRPEPRLSTREWADLPTHHPLVDIDG